MNKKLMGALLAASMVGTMLSSSMQAMAGDEETTVTWFASRPVDGAIDQTMREIAEKYSEEHGGKWKLEVTTEADRPSYLSKLRTLIAGGNMPDIIDIDATPYCQELVDAGLLVDVKSWLQKESLYDKYQPTALAYQEFTNGTMYTLPLEYHVEMIWYNKKLFADNGIKKTPETMDEWLEDCKILSDAGVTPIAVDGVDRWPVLRYLAFVPFREAANDYIINLSEGKASMGDKTGKDGIDFIQKIGPYFQEGFGATDYATAQAMFLGGQAAMYYIGDWEIGAMQEAYDKGTIDYFYLPMTENATTDANEFCVNSGIGMAFNTSTFEDKTEDFIKYVIDNYSDIYATKGQMSPIKADLPTDNHFTDLYTRIHEDMNKLGKKYMKPWDCYLDSNTCTVMEDNLLLLAAGDQSADDFITSVDDSIADYVDSQ